MMKRLRLFILFFLLFLPQHGNVFSWGFWAHKKINRMAVFTLPPEMVLFYKKHIDYITDHSIDPDRRRNVMHEEAPRHYFDTEHYGSLDSVPQFWKDAVEKYGEDSLNAYGIVPWHIVKMTYMLTDAFSKKDAYRILRYSADLGHYVADAHVPLHTTENYNGQLTGQSGLHNFWESRLPELYGESYDYFTGKAAYIDNPQTEAWQMVRESFAAVDSVLRFERELSASFPPDKKYSYEQHGSVTKKVYSKEFSEKYNEMLNGMVERRLRLAIQRVGGYWYTAWINAGSPKLDPELMDEISRQIADSIKAEQKLWKASKKLKPKGHID
jgi:hypothetical protein